jgi:hypothetical protein
VVQAYGAASQDACIRGMAAHEFGSILTFRQHQTIIGQTTNNERKIVTFRDLR